jgi:phosphopantetheinyl transferase (holo-ACP synthase)
MVSLWFTTVKLRRWPLHPEVLAGRMATKECVKKNGGTGPPFTGLAYQSGLIF